MLELGLSFMFVIFVFLLPILFLASLFLLLAIPAILAAPVAEAFSAPPGRIQVTKFVIYERVVPLEMLQGSWPRKVPQSPDREGALDTEH